MFFVLALLLKLFLRFKHYKSLFIRKGIERGRFYPVLIKLLFLDNFKSTTSGCQEEKDLVNN